MFYLREATSAQVMIGPFVGSDGGGLVSLTVSPELLRVSKDGGTFAAKNLTASNAIHNENAYYATVFDDTDTGSLGRLLVACSIDTALPLWQEFTVLPTSIYDAWVEGSVRQDVNLLTWRGTAPNALSSSRVDATVGAMQDTVITSAAIEGSAPTRFTDDLLAKDMSAVSATIAARSPLNALRALRNRVDTSSGTLIVFEEDDATAAWSASITQNESAAPIVEVDPV